ncbi:hypothetical protein FRC01_005558, partial [Tulasnella sp. 417]
MNATANIFEQPITERPEIPAGFGEDGGKFYYYYDQLADELDEDLTKRLKSQLDSLLIFTSELAGRLFAGVNSAFLALTLPMMSADPADDTNALLLQLVKGGNTTINSAADLPSATFSPPTEIYPVNVLFAVSLTCALMSSFLAVLGQQWLVYHRKRSGGGAEHQRKEQLRRQLGAQRWRLELILDDILPALLQAGLVIFCISFILYLRTLSGSMSSVVSAIVGTALAITVGAAVCATWDRMCPYQSPLSHLLCWTMDKMKAVVVAAVWLYIFVKTSLHQVLWAGACLPERRKNAAGWNEPGESSPQRWASAQQIAFHGLKWVGRSEETANDLIVASVKRVILTSEHTAALIHAATNICAINDDDTLRQLLNDAEFCDRLHDLYLTFRVSYVSSPTRLRNMPKAATKAFAATLLHLALSVGTIMELVAPKDRPLTIKDSPQVQPAFSDDLTGSLWIFAKDVMLEPHLWNVDLKDVNHLPLLGILLDELFYGAYYDELAQRLRVAIETLSNLTTSHQLSRTLTCTVNLYMLSRKGDPGWQARVAPELLPQLFELTQTSYRARLTTWTVPFLAEAFQQALELRANENIDGTEVGRICLDVFRHACEYQDVPLYGICKSMTCVVRDIEVGIRHPATSEGDQAQLRGQRNDYFGIIMDKLESYRLLPYVSELGESWAETLQYIRDVAAVKEPGHPENRVTLELFRAVWVKVQTPSGFDLDYGDFGNEYGKFEALVNMGGCAKSLKEYRKREQGITLDAGVLRNQSTSSHEYL